MTNSADLLTELRTAREARRVAEELVAELRREVVARDVPRPWSFSHGGVAGWVKDQPARPNFITVESTRAEVDRKLRAAVRALTFDTSERPIDVHASASCRETGESVSGVWVHIKQTVPDCVRPEGHDWSVVCLDERAPAGHPSGRLLTEGCPHCDGQRKTLWIFSDHEHTVVTYEAPHHYPEGSVRRRMLNEGPMTATKEPLSLEARAARALKRGRCSREPCASKAEVLERIRTGRCDALSVQEGLRLETTVLMTHYAIRFHDRELGEAVRAVTARGFGITLEAPTPEDEERCWGVSDERLSLRQVVELAREPTGSRDPSR